MTAVLPGTSNVHALDRRTACATGQHAQRLVRLFQAAADALGGYASAELRVVVGAAPHVAVVAGDPPADGILDRPPVLVVTTAPGHAGCWLAVGTRAVWEIGDGVVVVHATGADPVTVRPPGAAEVPGYPLLVTPVRALLP